MSVVKLRTDSLGFVSVVLAIGCSGAVGPEAGTDVLSANSAADAATPGAEGVFVLDEMRIDTSSDPAVKHSWFNFDGL